MTSVSLKIDLKNGIIEIQSPPESFDAVVERAADLISRIPSAEPSASHISDNGTAEASASDEKPPLDNQKPSKEKARAKRSTGGSRVKSLKILDDLLSTSQRQEIKAFVEEKMPASQNELVATVSYKLKAFTKREGFSDDEIHTAIQAAGRKTPANLKAVFGNMTAASLGKQVDGKFFPNFKCDDLVNYDLPAKVKKANG